MGKKKSERIKGRLTFILFSILIAIFSLGTRVLYIKVVHGEEYETAAKEQQVSDYDMEKKANRGSIVDRNQQAFAVSTRVYDVVLDCRILSKLSPEEQEKTINGLVSIEELGVNYDTLKGYIAIDPTTGKIVADTNWKILKKQVSRETKEKISGMGLKGVEFGEDTKRSYPLGTVAANVIGFMRDTKWGLESQYDQEMSGVSGREFKTYDGDSSAIVQAIPADDGKTIVTTLDFTIQQYAEKAVATAVKTFNPENAAVLVMNPKTCEVLAMASSGVFDPNDPGKPVGLSDPDFAAKWEAMSEEEQYKYLMHSWKNFNVQNTFEPGSIFKPMVVAAALEENIITPNTTFYCGGSSTVYDRVINCWKRPPGHGAESLEDVLSNSCNVGMIDIGKKMGASLFYKYQKDFGFGEKTGIDLPGEESASTLLHAEDKIGPVDLATMSMGQSFNCTPIQIMTAFSAVINGGNLMKPYVVSQTVSPDGHVTEVNKPTVVRRVISQNTSDIVREYLRTVVDSGTGKKAKIDGYAIGGKTGTGEQGNRDDDKYTVSFIGFLPVDDPEIIAIAIIDKSEQYVEGSTSAAPMLKGLLEDIIRYKAIPPSYAVTTKTETDKKTVSVPDFTGQKLSEVSTSLVNENLEYEVIGTGNTVVNQVPHGGTDVDEGTKILIYVTKGEGDDGDIQVPDVRGKTYDDAIKILIDAQLQAVIKGDEGGIVASQEPKQGMFVKKNSEVSIIFEEKPKPQ